MLIRGGEHIRAEVPSEEHDAVLLPEQRRSEGVGRPEVSGRRRDVHELVRLAVHGRRLLGREGRAHSLVELRADRASAVRHEVVPGHEGAVRERDLPACRRRIGTQQARGLLRGLADAPDGEVEEREAVVGARDLRRRAVGVLAEHVAEAKGGL